MFSRRGIILAAAVCLFPVVSFSSSQDYVESRFRLSPTFWAVDVNGTWMVDGKKQDVGSSFSDVDFTGQLRGEWLPFRFGAFFETGLIKMSAKETRGGEKLTNDSTIGLHELGGKYRLGDEELYADVLVGIRFITWDADLAVHNDSNNQTSYYSAREDWTDPIIGTETGATMGEKWSFTGRLDFGGFGAGSEFAFNIAALFGYHPFQNASVLFGYRFYASDYNMGSSQDRVRFNSQFHGPQLGFVFHWGDSDRD